VRFFNPALIQFVSDVPMLAWLNRPIPMISHKYIYFNGRYRYWCLRPDSNLSYTMHAQCTWKCRKMKHLQGWNRFYPCVCFFITNKDWLLISVFWSASQTLGALSTTGWKPAFSLPLCGSVGLLWGRGDEYVDQCDTSYVSGLGLGDQHDYSVLSLAQ